MRLLSQIRAAVFDCSAYPAECAKGEGGKMGAPHVRVYPHGKGVDGDKRAFPTAFAFHAVCIGWIGGSRPPSPPVVVSACVCTAKLRFFFLMCFLC